MIIRMGFLQTTIRMSLQTIIWMHQCIANNHSDGLAFCKWSSGFLPFNQILLHFSFYFQQTSYFHPTNIIFKTFFLLLQIWGSRFNLADLSISKCSCFFTCCAFFCGWESNVWAFKCIFQVSSTFEQGEVFLTWRSIFERFWVGRSIESNFHSWSSWMCRAGGTPLAPAWKVNFVKNLINTALGKCVLWRWSPNEIM